MTDIAAMLARLPAYHTEFSRVNSEGFEAIHATLTEFFDFMILLSDAYLTATDEERAEIRHVVRDHQMICWALFDYISGCAQRAAKTRDMHWWRRALIGASIQGNQWDYRDMFVTLGEAYATVWHAGLSPDAMFKEVAKLSSTKKYPGGGTMRSFLNGFTKSLYFQGYVPLDESQRTSGSEPGLSAPEDNSPMLGGTPRD